MLNTCDSHDDCVVIYDTRDCPVCKIQSCVDTLEKEVDQLKDEVETLQKGE